MSDNTPSRRSSAKEISEHAANLVVNIADIPLDQLILDIGPANATQVNHLLQNCKQVIRKRSLHKIRLR